MKNIFLEHPTRIGETYITHFKFALYIGTMMILGGAACLLHAIFPFLFEKTGSQILFRLMGIIIERAPGTEDRMILLAQSIKKKTKSQNY